MNTCARCTEDHGCVECFRTPAADHQRALFWQAVVSAVALVVLWSTW